MDSRSDTFALALVAFHMLTGKLPFAEGSAQETMILRLTDRPFTLAETRPDVPWPPALEAVMERGLSREAALRPATAGEFAAAFAAAVDGMPAIEGEADGATRVIGAVPATRVGAAVEGRDADDGTEHASFHGGGPGAPALARDDHRRRGGRVARGGSGDGSCRTEECGIGDRHADAEFPAAAGYHRAPGHERARDRHEGRDPGAESGDRARGGASDAAARAREASGRTAGRTARVAAGRTAGGAVGRAIPAPTPRPRRRPNARATRCAALRR